MANQILNTVNTQLFALRNQMNNKEEELIKNSMLYGSDHEAVMKSRAQLEDIKKQLEIKGEEGNIYWDFYANTVSIYRCDSRSCETYKQFPTDFNLTYIIVLFVVIH